MTREVLRLEILKLAHTLGRPAAEAIGRARELENYILEEQAKVEALKKKTGNATPK